MIRDILVHVDGTQAGQRRIAYALEVAERHQARLTGVHVTAPVDVPPYYKPSRVDQVVDALEQRSEQNAQTAAALFRSAAATHAVEMFWQAVEGNMAREICNLARWNDLVIVGQYEHQDPAERHPLFLAEEIVQDCGRPVLVVPAQVETAAMGRALIAWDGGREVVRTLHDALPLLRQAKSIVEIAIIDDPSSGGLQPLLDHLQRHEIGIAGDVHLRGKGSTASVLVDRLGKGHFDLLVMGAYGHSAWLEFLFGGTTASALANASAPVLVSH